MCFRPIAPKKPKNCPICNAINVPQATVCKKCGAELSEEEIAK